MNTIQCIPKGFFSSDFRLQGIGHHGDLGFNWLTEQGALTVDDTSFEIRKHGPLSGSWTLEHNGTPVIAAQKSSPLVRAFALDTGCEEFALRARSPFGRSFELSRLHQTVASFLPDHPMTRRSQITPFNGDLDFRLLAFSFWLVVLTWNRSSGSD